MWSQHGYHQNQSDKPDLLAKEFPMSVSTSTQKEKKKKNQIKKRKEEAAGPAHTQLGLIKPTNGDKEEKTTTNSRSETAKLHQNSPSLAGPFSLSL